MDEENIRSSPPQRSNKASIMENINKKEEGGMSSLVRIKKDCFSFMVSLKEGFRYVKAIIFGQTKKLTANSEKELTEAELMAEKMQVEAANAAENDKARIYKSA